jgi:hypothetical protein
MEKEVFAVVDAVFWTFMHGMTGPDVDWAFFNQRL